MAEPESPTENKVCPGCQLTVMNENGGVVIAFGQSFFHVDCFKCAKCHDKVTADTNLLLLSDGQPVCSNCSYSCSVCHLPILDEAIMTGDDSYHAHCFKCRSCSNRIDELMFAKTSHGIYCMNCHHQRVARSRRHAQKQKEREREKAAGGSGSSKSRDRLAREHQRDEGATYSPAVPSPATAQRSAASTNVSSPEGPAYPAHPPQYRASTLPVQRNSGQSSPATPVRRSSLQSADEQQPPKGRPLSSDINDQTVHAPQRRSRNGQTTPLTPSLTVIPPAELGYSSHPSTRPPSPAIIVPPDDQQDSQSSLNYLQTSSEDPSDGALHPDAGVSAMQKLQKRKSYDDGVRPLNILSKQAAPPPQESVAGLNVPNKSLSRAGKRSSINPGMFVDLSALASEFSEKPPVKESLESLQRSASPSPARSSPRPLPSPSRDLHLSDLSRPPISQTSSNTSSQDPDQPHHQLRERGRAESSPKPHTTTEVARPPLRPTITLERVPPRTHSLSHSQDLSIASERPLERLVGLPSSVRPRPSFDDRPARALASSLSIDVERSRAGLRSRSGSPAPQPVASPAHKVDVPHGIESGTDTDEAESVGKNSANSSRRDTLPPAPPPKEPKPRPRPEKLNLDTAAPDDSMADASWSGSIADQESSNESSPVERVSHSTFIAPALPPIRFSMNAADFTDLLKSVNGRASMKPVGHAGRDSIRSLEQVAEGDWRAGTPPSSAASATTFTLSTESSTIADDASVTTLDASTAASSNGHGDGHSKPTYDRPAVKSNATELLSRQRSLRNGTVNGNIPIDDHSDTAFPASERSSSELGHDAPGTRSPSAQRQRFDSNASYNPDASISYESNAARITVTAPGSTVARPLKYDKADLVTRRLQEALQEASKRGSMHVNLDQEFVQAILMVVEQRKHEHAEMKGKLDNIKRASQQYIEGLTVAQEEYEAEVHARRDAEAEVTRLRVLLSGQAARITAMSGASRKEELHKQLTRELSDNLSILEQDVSKLKVERDVALVEVEELASSISSPTTLASDTSGIRLSRSLTTRLDGLKAQYQRELVPLTDERESLVREIAELRAARDVFLEETTMLNSRNEELAQLNALYMRRTEAGGEKPRTSTDRQIPPAAVLQPSSTTLTNSSLGTDESATSREFVKISKPVEQVDTPGTTRKKFPWRAVNKETPAVASATPENIEKGRVKHVFQQISVLRFTRCDHCGDKLWGSQVRCTGCSISVHPRCQANVYTTCTPQASSRRDESPATLGPMPPSMFGRDLIEQVRADSKTQDRMVPMIVEKCIDAVENSAMDYEGIYRKTGGSGQSKMITQLFERGDYDAFDLRDSDRFNDICSVTSVLKTYFRTLPNPLLTYALHDEFMHASTADPLHKGVKYADLVKQLPTEHYYTLRLLMLHLNRIHQQSSQNLMTARNLGVVFGPTLMRSRNPGAEFSDMAGKALSVEWLVENAPNIFPSLPASH